MDACSIAQEWRLEPQFADSVVRVIRRFEAVSGHPVQIISGFRSRAEQDRLRRQGRPAAPDNLSNHRTCPARAVDLSLGFAPSDDLKRLLGRIAADEGLRWGGGSTVDPWTGIPSDWNHLDPGPRWS